LVVGTTWARDDESGSSRASKRRGARRERIERGRSVWRIPIVERTVERRPVVEARLVAHAGIYVEAPIKIDNRVTTGSLISKGNFETIFRSKAPGRD